MNEVGDIWDPIEILSVPTIMGSLFKKFYMRKFIANCSIERCSPIQNEVM